MAPSLEHALLPEGLQDTLPPDAAYEARVTETLIGTFSGHGYDRVAPPLIEFEESFIEGAIKQRSPAMVRAMDPVSQRMMAIRSDFTPQVARIATTRLEGEPRPLRLCYAGPVMRVRGSQLRPERQFTQVGGELFGSENIAADVEVLTVAAHALVAVGVTDLTIDLVVPSLVPSICQGLGLSNEATAEAREALQAKDIGGLDGFDGEAGRILRALLALAGPAEHAIKALEDLPLPAEAADLCRNLTELVTLVSEKLPDISLTVDPGEYLSFEYHTGIAFSFFTRGVRSELGRGGRYIAGSATGRPEPAVGFTAFLDTVMRAVPPLTPAARAYLPLGEDARLAERLRADGWQVIEALDVDADAEETARRLGCSHIVSGGETLEISSG